MENKKAIEIIKAYIDDPLIINKYDFVEALKKAVTALELWQKRQKSFNK